MNSDAPQNPLELERETMRSMGYRVVDHLVERIASLDQDVAWRGAPRAELASVLEESAPDHPAHFDDLVRRLNDDVLNYAARVDHPRFMAFVPGCPTWPAILGDFIAAGHNIFQGTWLGSAGPSMLELVVLGWFRDWVGFPATTEGLLLSGGSAANLTALACARISRSLDATSPAALYIAQESHSSVTKAARILGFRADLIRVIPGDSGQRMRVDALHAAIARDVSEGILPLAIVGNAGTTSTGAIDPLTEIAELAAQHSIWFHVDAAYGGFATLTARGKAALRGIELADSLTLDPHKWLYQPFEIGCLLVRDGRMLDRAFQARPDYLQDATPAGADINFGERGVQLTRSARAIKVWLSIQYFGLNAFRSAIDQCLDLALYAETRVKASAKLELVTPASLGILSFRRVAQGLDLDALNARLVQQLGLSGQGLLSSTRVNGVYAIRICVLNHRTDRGDIDQLLDWLEAAPLS